MIDFSLTDEQELLLDSLREFMEQYGSEAYFKECDREGRYPEEFVRAFNEAGFGLLGVDEELGGTPVDTVTQTLFNFELYRLGAPINFLGINTLGIRDLQHFGNKEQLDKICRGIETNGQGICMAFTEPCAGSDSAALQTTYTRRDGKVYLNGQKTFITCAMEAPYALVMSRTDQPVESPLKAFTLWLVDLSKPGITRNKLHKIGMHMISNCEIYFDDVELDESDMVGIEGNAFFHLMDNFETERMGACAAMVGTAECAFEDAAKYVTQRVQFGKPVGMNQLVQEKLVDMKAKIEGMKYAVLKSSWEADNGGDLRLASSMLKRYCAQNAFEVCDDAVQLMGGIGYTDEARVSRLWRDVRVSRIGAGTDEIMAKNAGKVIFKQFA